MCTNNINLELGGILDHLVQNFLAFYKCLLNLLLLLDDLWKGLDRNCRMDLIGFFSPSTAEAEIDLVAFVHLLFSLARLQKRPVWCFFKKPAAESKTQLPPHTTVPSHMLVFTNKYETPITKDCVIFLRKKMIILSNFGEGKLATS